MPFQFQCPNAHLLQAEPHQAGQQSQCPVCNIRMIIPPAPPVAIPLDPAGISVTDHHPHDSPGIAESTGPEAPRVLVGEASCEPEFYHIPCPNGHELETPSDMLGQYVMCPTCNAQFQLDRQDSVEVRRRKQLERDARAARTERSWLNWAIALVVLVLLGLATLIVVSVIG